ncbi:hypothetical protein QIS74_13306 [Colletotrichum tabaci]|uniref:Uncharacterized protein n=1 Tax=Colletotrichum tabaci TaxID=1209068 RepID=A0AAV9STJ6_9PEZI
MNETAKPSVFTIDGNVVGTSTASHLAQLVVTALKGLESPREWRKPPRLALRNTFETVPGASRKDVWVPNGWRDEKQGLDQLVEH